jgi:hypothetical protein
VGYHLRFSRFTHWLINSFSVSQESKQQILQPLSVLRPKFRVNATFAMYSHLITNITTLPGCCPILARPREHGFCILNARANNTNRIWCLSKKLSKECCWITTVCSLRWAFRHVCGAEPVRSIRAIANSLSSWGWMGI